ncbi:hypothetical protein BD410DRAFT_896394 [Rickenella mellea]|uniref:SAP domain-containing protein n=1 Tax=Rickenella mellea TaxID=50990 RepID=A0A4Y7QD42_9AGAM|nr:hypothetical protein BD410DRAFT_896394 [Rickenella mellea]
MLRARVCNSPRFLNRAAQRNLVSSVLLTRPYEGKSLVELKQEAKKRGLTVSGTKASLISRIYAEDQRREREALSPAAASPQHSRNLSSSTPRPAEPTSATPTSRHSFTVFLPDLTKPPPEPPIQIPFAPDFWESSKVRAAEEAKEAQPATPKIHTMAEPSTHLAGGPSHNVYQPKGHHHADVHAEEHLPELPSRLTGIWKDIVDDLNIPTSFTPRKAGHEAEAALRASLPDFDSGHEKSYSRPLDVDERRGIWTLLGIFVGSLVVSRVAAPSKKH